MVRLVQDHIYQLAMSFQALLNFEDQGKHTEFDSQAPGIRYLEDGYADGIAIKGFCIHF